MVRSKLDPWFIVLVAGEVSLAGICYNDSRKEQLGNQIAFDDGHRVVTSELVSIKDNEATTKSGSKYSLGERGTIDFFKQRNFNQFCSYLDFDTVLLYEEKE